MRSVLLSNGRLAIGYDAAGSIRDVFYPRLGQPNHAGGWPSRFGAAVDGVFAWFHDPPWSRTVKYRPGSLVAETHLRHPSGIHLTLSEAVLAASDVLIRDVQVVNPLDRAVTVELFFHMDLSLMESDIGDTVLYDPDAGGLLYYKRHLYTLLVGMAQGQSGLSQFTCGLKRFRDFEGTWRDAEDGRLSQNAVAQGSVDAVASLRMVVKGHGHAAGQFAWVFGQSREEVSSVAQETLQQGPRRLIRDTDKAWRQWSDRTPTSDALLRHSHLVLRAMTDREGGILAGLDSDIMGFNRDHYGYVWLRDASLIALSLIDHQRPDAARPFFRWAAGTERLDGAFLHKYNPDGSPGSTWHPAWMAGHASLPIQADETALFLMALARYGEATGDIALWRELWPDLISPAATFLANFRRADGLPEPCWDLWEERYGIHAWTLAATIGGLRAATTMGDRLGFVTPQWGRIAQDMADAARSAFWEDTHGVLARSLSPDLAPDLTPDASLYGLVRFGVLSPRSKAAEDTRSRLLKRLTVRPIGGIARYQGDQYFRPWRLDPGIPGNPWIVTTCWLAEWSHLAGDVKTARSLQRWAVRQATATGMLAEQMDAYTGKPLSVVPLAWSHAAILDLDTVLNLNWASEQGPSESFGPPSAELPASRK